MPFKSEKQRGFLYTNKPKLAKEFEEATPEGTKLPNKVKKMAEGGEVKEGDAFTEASKDGVNHDLNHIKEVYDSFMHKHQFGTFPKLEKGIKEDFTINSSTKNYAGGGMVQSIDQDFLNKLNQGTAMTPEAAVPPLDQTMQAVNQTPDTNYDFYGDVGNEQRKALYNQLLQKQTSGGNMLAQAAGGIGDAISNSFGGQHNKFQDEARGIAEQNTANRIGAVDTQRQQKMQDMQGGQEMMMNDPKHPIAVAMRETLKANGMQVPSGMPVSLMVKVAGPLGELALKQATLAQGAQQFGVTSGRQSEELNRQKEKDKQEMSEKNVAQQMDAAKGLSNRPWYQKAAELVPGIKSDATKTFQAQLQPESTPQAPAGPQPGLEEDGYRFKGGNPADPTAWEKI